MLASSFRQVCLPQHCRLTDERENPTGVEDNISESSQAMISKGQKQQRFGRKPGEEPRCHRSTERQRRTLGLSSGSVECSPNLAHLHACLIDKIDKLPFEG